MDVTTILILLLVGAIATYFSGDKLASKVALLFSVATLGVSLYLLNQFSNGTTISYLSDWMEYPKTYLAFQADGLSMLMVLLTTTLTPLIIFSSFGNNYSNAKSFYALVLFMSFAMVGTFLAADGLLYYIFWELALIPIYFIALLWGNGDADERKKAVVKFFIYTLAGSLFMLIAFAYLYQKTNSFLLGNLFNLQIALHVMNRILEKLLLAQFLIGCVKVPIAAILQRNISQKQTQITVLTGKINIL